MRYKIYAGLGGGFGSATSQGVFEYDSMQEAEEDAYNLAIEAYESYGGLHGLTTWDECRQELYDNGDITDDMPESDVYSIVEVNVPKGFTATYSQSGYVFTVTNSASLIQTGQLIWPIPVLALAGLCLIAVGCIVLRKTRNENA